MGSRGFLWVRLWEIKNIMGLEYGSNISDYNRTICILSTRTKSELDTYSWKEKQGYMFSHTKQTSQSEDLIIHIPRLFTADEYTLHVLYHWEIQYSGRIYPSFGPCWDLSTKYDSDVDAKLTSVPGIASLQVD
jgi:hypothetical protein